ncbi:unnamed protein product [Linum trigynum]|uniref:SHSP domain-containing protein n=1 Tax=Linum trigynum TaxID=586398 RepID=A0AAV2FVS3_9ROSI
MVEDLSSSELSIGDEWIYEDIKPDVMRWDLRHRIIVFFSLPGFEKEHVEVQRIGSDVLAITGQRPLADGHRWIRFKKLIRFRAIYNIAEYRAGFGKSDFIIKIPKIIAPAITDTDDEEATAKQHLMARGDSDEDNMVQKEQPELSAIEEPLTTDTTATIAPRREKSAKIQPLSATVVAIKRDIVAQAKEEGGLVTAAKVPDNKSEINSEEPQVATRSQNQQPIVQLGNEAIIRIGNIKKVCGASENEKAANEAPPQVENMPASLKTKLVASATLEAHKTEIPRAQQLLLVATSQFDHLSTLAGAPPFVANPTVELRSGQKLGVVNWKFKKKARSEQLQPFLESLPSSRRYLEPPVGLGEANPTAATAEIQTASIGESRLSSPEPRVTISRRKEELALIDAELNAATNRIVARGREIRSLLAELGTTTAGRNELEKKPMIRTATG